MGIPDPATTCEVSPEELRALLKADAVRLIDCREDDEFVLCQIEGARLVPLQQIPARIAEIEGEGDLAIVVYCHHGMRSLNATQFLRSKGLAESFSLRGGIDAWSITIDPQIPRY